MNPRPALDPVYDAHDIAAALGITPDAARRIEDVRALWFRVPGRRGAVITRQQYDSLIEKWQEEGRA